MKSVPQSSVVLNAYNTIAAILVTGDWRAGHVFPSVSELMASTGASRVSVIKAIALLKSEGRLSGAPRSRLRVGPPALPRAEIATDEEAWRSKRAALESDILSGRYADLGALPSFKILQAHYGCCFRTMKKSVRSLVEDSVVQFRNKRYELIQVSGTSTTHRIVFIVNRTSARATSALNQGQYRVMELFEQECARRGVTPDVVEMDLYNPAEVRKVMHGALFSKHAEGFVFDLWWYESKEFLESYHEVLAQLALLKRPVAILDEIGEAKLPALFSRNPLVQLFSIEGTRAGAAVARTLLSLGHTSAVYLSAFHNQAYSLQRLEGIVEQFARTGKQKLVVPVVTDRVEQPLGYVLALSGFDEITLSKVIAVGRTDTQAADMNRLYQEYRRRLDHFPLGAKERAALRKNLSPLIGLARRNLDRGYFETACRALIAHAENQLVGDSLTYLFQRALEVRDATVWICVTDFVAVAAIDFLREKGITVPDEISVVGFDNSPILAFENRLTSYDFNANGFVHAMLNFIARPRRPRGDYSHKVIEVAGTVIRRSTATRPLTS